MKKRIKELKDVKEFKNVKEILYNSAEAYKDNVAFVIKHKNGKNVEYENITYKEFLKDINALGTAYYDLGVQNERIAVAGRNRYEWVLAHFANLLGGIVSVPLDKELQVEELESSLVRSKAGVLVFDEKYIDKIEEIKQRGKTNIKEYICMSEYEGYKDVKALMKLGKEKIESGDKRFLEAKIDNDKMNILLFTSGTTNKSKAVMLSQRNIASNIYAMQLVEPIYSTYTNLAFLPFNHIFGSTGITMMLACGVKNAFPDGLRYVAQNLNEYKVSLFIGVPLLIEAIYKNIMKEIERQGKTKIIKMAMKIGNFLLKFHIDIRRKLFKQVLDKLRRRACFSYIRRSTIR